MRTLTEAEVALVRRHARRKQNAFWALLPLVALTVGASLLVGVSLLDDGRHVLIGLVALGVGPLVAFAAWAMLWRPAAVLARLGPTTPLRTLRGVLRQKSAGRYSRVLSIDDTMVEVVSAELRAKVALGDRCVAEVIDEAPVLVVDWHTER